MSILSVTLDMMWLRYGVHRVLVLYIFFVNNLNMSREYTQHIDEIFNSFIKFIIFINFNIQHKSTASSVSSWPSIHTVRHSIVRHDVEETEETGNRKHQIPPSTYISLPWQTHQHRQQLMSQGLLLLLEMSRLHRGSHILPIPNQWGTVFGCLKPKVPATTAPTSKMQSSLNASAAI